MFSCVAPITVAQDFDVTLRVFYGLLLSTCREASVSDSGAPKVLLVLTPLERDSTACEAAL